MTTIRAAHLSDLAAVRALVASAYGHYVERIGREPGPMRDDYQRRIAEGQTWVLEDAGVIIGLVVLEALSAALLLDNVAVAPTEQGKGHGRQLIAFAEQEARRRGYAELRLYTHVLMTENIALYGRLGFSELGRLREKEFARVFMAKRLPG